MTASSDKLAQTRLAILAHVHRKELRRSGQGDDAALRQAGPGARPQVPHEEPIPEGHGWMATASHALRSWWRYHPAHMAVDIATPALSSYARRRPVQFLGIAAAAGALFFLARPWKLISVTGVLVALVKSPQVASLIMSAMSSSQNPKDDPPV